MKICNNGHSEIVYKGEYSCPLCSLIKHNSTVHDFIESKGDKLVSELVDFQNKKRSKERDRL